MLSCLIAFIFGLWAGKLLSKKTRDKNGRFAKIPEWRKWL